MLPLPEDEPHRLQTGGGHRRAQGSGEPRIAEKPLRAGDEVRGGICEATTSLEPDGAGAKAVTELVENTELEGPEIDSPVGSQQLAAPLGGGALSSPASSGTRRRGLRFSSLRISTASIRGSSVFRLLKSSTLQDQWSEFPEGAIAVLDEVEIGAVLRTEKLLGSLDRGREEFAGSDLLEDASTQLLVRDVRVENETSQT